MNDERLRQAQTTIGEQARSLLALRAELEQQYKAGHHDGAQEALAYMTFMGGCMIMGKWVPIRFEWPDEQFAEQVKNYAQRTLEAAYQAGRQQEPPRR